MAIFRSRDERTNDTLVRETLDSVPTGMRIAAAWSWRFLVVAGAIAVVGFLIVQLKIIVIPFFVAVIISALLVPFKNFLIRHRWPHWLAILVALVAFIVVVGGLITLVVLEVRASLPSLEAQGRTRVEDLTAWLHGPPFSLTDADIEGYLADLTKSIQSNSSGIFASARHVTSTAGDVLAGAAIVLFSTIFMVIDGRKIFLWVTRLFPRKARTAVRGAGDAGWVTLTAFVRVQILVAFVDAVGIGLGAFVIGLFNGGFPLLVPIIVLVFLGAFIPIVGAVLSGALAVLVALIFLGPLPALIMLLVVIGVQQLEGHVLHPFVTGSAVRVHPLAVVLGVAGFGFVAGIAGAFFAVPTIAMANVMVTYIARGDWRRNPHPDDVEDVKPLV